MARHALVESQRIRWFSYPITIIQLTSRISWRGVAVKHFATHLLNLQFCARVIRIPNLDKQPPPAASQQNLAVTPSCAPQRRNEMDSSHSFSTYEYRGELTCAHYVDDDADGVRVRTFSSENSCCMLVIAARLHPGEWWLRSARWCVV